MKWQGAVQARRSGASAPGAGEGRDGREEAAVGAGRQAGAGHGHRRAGPTDRRAPVVIAS